MEGLELSMPQNRCVPLIRPLSITSVIVVLVLLGLPLPGRAQPSAPADAAASISDQQADPSTLSLEELLGIEVESVFGASKTLQKITEAPAAVTVVTAQDIARFGWRTLADVMRNVRGLYVTGDRSYAYLGVRGVQPPGDYTTRILLTLDGFRLNDNVYDEALLEEDFQVDMGDVDRIEIIRGPNSSLYGSNAFFGIVNITTKNPGQGRAAEVTAGYGTDGWKETRGRLRHAFANGGAVSVSGALVQAAGAHEWYSPVFDDPSTHNGVAVDQDYTRRRNLLSRWDKGGLSVTAIYNWRRRANGTAAYGSIFGRDAWTDDEHNVVSATWQRTLKGGWNGVFRGGWDRYEYTGIYAYDWETATGLQSVQYVDRADGQFLTGEAQFSRAFGRAHQFTGGVEQRDNFRQNQFSSIKEPYESLWRLDHKSRASALYLQDQWRVHSRVLINGGLRWDHYAGFDDPIKPRIAAILQPGRATTLKLIYGGAFRAPSAYEGYYEIPGLWVSRPNLRPEQIQTAEAIVEHYAGKRVRLSAGVFRNTVTDLITLVSTAENDDVVGYTNQGSAQADGFETEIEARWPGGLQGRISYTLSNAHDTGSSAPAANSPRHLTQAVLAVPLRETVFASFTMQTLSSRLSLDGKSVPRYVRPSVAINGSLTPRLTFDVVVGNVTNTRFSDPVGDDFAQDTIERERRNVRAFLTWGF